jgi:hypothetical protein
VSYFWGNTVAFKKLSHFSLFQISKKAQRELFLKAFSPWLQFLKLNLKSTSDTKILKFRI